MIKIYLEHRHTKICSENIFIQHMKALISIIMLACLSVVTALFVINLITYEISETEWKKYIVSKLLVDIATKKRLKRHGSEWHLTVYLGINEIFQLSLVDQSKRTPSGSTDTQELEYNEYTRFLLNYVLSVLRNRLFKIYRR